MAEHAPRGRRGYATSWIQTTATLGFFMSLAVIALCRTQMDAKVFADWGWRVPFLVSLILLVFSVYIRLKLNESPLFTQMKAEGKGSKSPLTDSFLRYPNNKYVLLALLGATAGQGVVWYTGQFYALFFLLITLKLDFLAAYTLIGISLLIGTPMFIFFGWLSDRIGRLKIILAGCLIAAVTYFPLFAGADALRQSRPRSLPGQDQDHGHGRSGAVQLPHLRRSVVEVHGMRPRQGCADQVWPVLHLGERAGGAAGRHPDQRQEARGLRRQGRRRRQARRRPQGSGLPGRRADLAKVNWFMAEVILVIMLVYVTMVYGPIAAFLVEMFPTNIRYTSMSLPYHIGNGWFGGMLPLLATALVAWSGDIYFGLWYPIGIAVMTLVIGTIFLKPRRKPRTWTSPSRSTYRCKIEPAAPQGPPVSFWRIVIPSAAREPWGTQFSGTP